MEARASDLEAGLADIPPVSSTLSSPSSPSQVTASRTEQATRLGAAEAHSRTSTSMPPLDTPVRSSPTLGDHPTTLADGPETSAPMERPSRSSSRRLSRTATRTSAVGQTEATTLAENAPDSSPDSPSATSPATDTIHHMNVGPLHNHPGQRRSLYARVRAFFGHGNPRRKLLVSTIFGLTFFTAQTIICAVFITLTQVQWKSHTNGSVGESEWLACNVPLGDLMIIWLVRCLLGLILEIWTFTRKMLMYVYPFDIQRRAAREREERRRERRARRQAVRAELVRRRALARAAAAAANAEANATTPRTEAVAQLEQDLQGLERSIETLRRDVDQILQNPDSDRQPDEPEEAQAQQQPGQQQQQQQQAANANPFGRWDAVYRALLNITSLLAMVHFGITNVLLFDSTKTCRVTSPHLWWSTFGLLCLTYITILEVLVIAFTIFVIMPLIFIGLNVILILTGHRPMSARQMIDPGHINPETPKMPQKLVDKIPLVLYIPAPEEKKPKAKQGGGNKKGKPSATDEPAPNTEKDTPEMNEDPALSRMPPPIDSAPNNPSPPPSIPAVGLSYPPRSDTTSTNPLSIPLPPSCPPSPTPEEPEPELITITVPPRAGTSNLATAPSSPTSAPSLSLTQEGHSPLANVPTSSSLLQPDPRFTFLKRKKRTNPRRSDSLSTAAPATSSVTEDAATGGVYAYPDPSGANSSVDSPGAGPSKLPGMHSHSRVNTTSASRTGSISESLRSYWTAEDDDDDDNADAMSARSSSSPAAGHDDATSRADASGSGPHLLEQLQRVASLSHITLPISLAGSRPQSIAEKRNDADSDEAEEDEEEEDEDEGEWEDRYEKSPLGLPFVRLENNRATCAICLMDFDEPPRRSVAKVDPPAATSSAGTSAKGKGKGKGKAADTKPSAAKKVEEEPALVLTGGSGDGEPEPLRLLGCGHVFHKSCLDPWLTGVSGRCPTCQRKVEVGSKGKKSKRQ
ncbi:hypothetical protein DL93DRAFT_2172321 [Clavulina sp. PMI_390]|nr:hypothetical protein DL93DRAFT_2172321 [Clavulina sp. PMI_390]